LKLKLKTYDVHYIEMEYRRRYLTQYEHDDSSSEHVCIPMSLDDQIEQQMDYLYHHPFYVCKVAVVLGVIMFILYASKSIMIA
jgi:hypothetical protein